ncbi:MAG: lytic murein transglycosylase [Alphaproteobacteria bacterium]|nr:lytic murein transglycosylase [Alphaproteobacteria bacterium]
MKKLLKSITYLIFCGVFVAPFFAWADADFENWKKDFEKEALKAGIKKETLDRYVPQIQLLPRVIEQDIKMPEFLQNFWDYTRLRLTPERIAKGQEMMRTYPTWLKRVADKYGVEPQYLVALWGMETNYGTYLGKTKLLNSLGTLAYHPRRRSYFTKELIAYFKILESEPYPPQWGSWDGGFGNFQFMPTTFIAYAVDADGNGTKSLVGSIPDSFASAANFLHAMGWKADQPWGWEVSLKEGFDWEKLHDKTQEVQDWFREGVSPVGIDVFPENEKAIQARLLTPQGADGPFFLVYPNFDYLRRWNGLELYGITTALLADILAGRREAHAYPENFEPIRTETVMKAQEILSKKGYYNGTPDGKLGTKTRSALRHFQRENNLKQDGYLNKETLIIINTY